MKGRVDKSRGIVTVIAKTLATIKPTESLSQCEETKVIRFLRQFSGQRTTSLTGDAKTMMSRKS
jgi:hypothetical protein